MKLQYLGTSGAEGMPGIFCDCDICLEAEKRKGPNLRMRPCALIDDSILLDYSPDLYSARLRFGVRLSQVRNVFVTHPDAEHFHPELLEFYPYGSSIIRKGEGVTFYGNRSTKARFDAFMATRAGKRAEGYADYRLIEAFESISVNDITFTALPANHGVPGFCNLYLVERGSSSLLYAHDTGRLPESVWEYLKNKKLTCVSMDASYGAHPTLDSGHMNFAMDIETHERMLKEGILADGAYFILNHFLHVGGMLHEEITAMMAPRGMLPAYDGMVIHF